MIVLKTNDYQNQKGIHHRLYLRHEPLGSGGSRRDTLGLPNTGSTPRPLISSRNIGLDSQSSQYTSGDAKTFHDHFRQNAC